MPPPWVPPDLDDLIQSYVSGVSENALAKRYSVARNTIRRHLTLNGVDLRGVTEANRLEQSRRTPEQRAEYVAAAHAAARGSRRTHETKCNMAQGREKVGGCGSGLEALLAEWLVGDWVPQKAVGPYNCDFASGSVAVEVFGGNWHFSGRHLARAQDRFRYLLDAGWHVMVVVHAQWMPLRREVADHIHAFVDFADRNPTAIRQYRMVGGGGEPLVAESADLDHLTVVYPRSRTRNARGQYEGIPRQAMRV